MFDFPPKESMQSAQVNVSMVQWGKADNLKPFRKLMQNICITPLLIETPLSI